MVRSHRSIRSPIPYPTIVFTLAVALGLSVWVPAVEAQVGRVGVTVTDPSGEPLEGVDIRVTQDDVGVDMSRTTNKKGKAKFALRNGVQVHLLTLTKDGFRTLDHQFKPGAGSSYLEFTLEPHAQSAPSAAPAEGGAEGGAVGKLTPAQEVFNQGVTALQAEDFSTAKQKFNEALGMDSNLMVAHLALAGVHFEEGDLESARSAAETVLAADSENARALHILYESYKKEGNEKDAEATLQRLSKLESGGNAAAIIYNDGVSAMRLGDTARAMDRLEKSLEIDPQLHASMRLLTRIYQAEGQHEKAVEMGRRALAIQPGESRVAKALYESLKALGRDGEAQEVYAQLASEDPTTLINDFSKKGEDAFNGGDTQAAVGFFQQIIELNPDHADAHYFLGLGFVNLGKNAEAKTHFEKFVALAADDPRVETAKEMLGFL